MCSAVRIPSRRQSSVSVDRSAESGAGTPAVSSTVTAPYIGPRRHHPAELFSANILVQCLRKFHNDELVGVSWRGRHEQAPVNDFVPLSVVLERVEFVDGPVSSFARNRHDHTRRAPFGGRQGGIRNHARPAEIRIIKTRTPHRCTAPRHTSAQCVAMPDCYPRVTLPLNDERPGVHAPGRSFLPPAKRLGALRADGASARQGERTGLGRTVPGDADLCRGAAIVRDHFAA